MSHHCHSHSKMGSDPNSTNSSKMGSDPISAEDACCASHLPVAEAGHGHGHHGDRGEFYRLLLALLMALIAEAMAFLQPESGVWQLVSMGLAAAAIALAGLGVLRKGLAALVRVNLNINALMSVAVIGAFIIGEWPEAAMVMALYSLAELIEHRSVDRARDAIQGLLDIAPSMAERRQSDGSWESIAVEEVGIGEILRVGPGDRLPLDGVVIAGASAVNQSPVTGESMPVEKVPGDDVFAGTINQHGSLEFQVTAHAADTVLARIIHAVEAAQNKKAPTQRFIDRFARIYTPGVFVLAILVALGGPWLFGLAWLDGVYRALVLLVIACPCALVISTPVTIVSGLAAAARRGILIKGGVYLEQARKLALVALDKTGTITMGRPQLVAQALFVEDSANPAALNRESVLTIAAALAGRSNHPVAQAIASGLPQADLEVEHFHAEAGLGVVGHVNGKEYRLASHRRVVELGLSTPELEQQLHTHESQGRTVSLLIGSQDVMALFAVADTLRPAASQAVNELKKMGITAVMLTGDNSLTAASVAIAAGIEDVRSELLPEQKLQALQGLARPGKTVAMVGDGINDAPALAAADMGFAMGGIGTHTAMEAADIVIMNDDLRRIPETIRLSRRTHTLLWQNISLALGIKAVFLGLAVTDQATMWMAVFADMGASLLVVFNGLRLLRHRPHIN